LNYGQAIISKSSRTESWSSIIPSRTPRALALLLAIRARFKVKKLMLRTRPVETVPNRCREGLNEHKGRPLAISTLSIQFKHGSLFMGVDATLKMGSHTLTAQAFTLESNLTGDTFDSLQDTLNPANKELHVSISGLEAAVSKQPLTVKGVFLQCNQF
jgi:hypothetical protein